MFPQKRKTPAIPTQQQQQQKPMTKTLTAHGYAVDKADLTRQQVATIQKELMVTPYTFAGTGTPFRVWMESEKRFYLPRSWAEAQFGPADADIREAGEPLGLTFQGTLRPIQEAALAALDAANGIICLPCGFGKTFTGIAAAARIGKRFLVVVHKEFLADQWSEELRRLLPGVRIGRVQGERCDTEDVDVSIAMIQTLCSRPFAPTTFRRFGFAIFDEVHHLGAEHFSQTLQRVHCRRMLGLTATPTRVDGLSKVFEWHLGPIIYKLSRPPDEGVRVEVLRYACDDPAYAEVATDWKGDIIRPRMINQIADYAPRTAAILEWLAPWMEEPARKLLILSDRREHLVAFEAGFRAKGLDPGYYVGGMKQKDLDVSAGKRVILGTFAMASEGMNIPTLNAVLLATPKSNVEQSVGRILRLKPEERLVQPVIFDVLDTTFVECLGQWARRKKYYKQCGYLDEGKEKGREKGKEKETEKEKEKKGVCLIEDE